MQYKATICNPAGFDFHGHGNSDHEAFIQAYGEALQALKGKAHDLRLIVSRDGSIVYVQRSVLAYILAIQ